MHMDSWIAQLIPLVIIFGVLPLQIDGALKLRDKVWKLWVGYLEVSLSELPQVLPTLCRWSYVTLCHQNRSTVYLNSVSFEELYMHLLM